MPDDFARLRPDPADATALVTRLARLMPAAADAAIVGGWSGMYEVSPDWNPIMGTAAGVAGLHYAVGFSGHGFKLSPVVGILMAEQVAEGQELRGGYPGAGVIG